MVKKTGLDMLDQNLEDNSKGTASSKLTDTQSYLEGFGMYNITKD